MEEKEETGTARDCVCTPKQLEREVNALILKRNVFTVCTVYSHRIGRTDERSTQYFCLAFGFSLSLSLG